MRELRQFHYGMPRLHAAWRVARAVLPLIATLWEYYRGRGGLTIAEPLTRGTEGEHA